MNYAQIDFSAVTVFIYVLQIIRCPLSSNTWTSLQFLVTCLSWLYTTSLPVLLFQFSLRLAADWLQSLDLFLKSLLKTKGAIQIPWKILTSFTFLLFFLFMPWVLFILVIIQSGFFSVCICIYSLYNENKFFYDFVYSLIVTGNEYILLCQQACGVVEKWSCSIVPSVLLCD